MAKPAYLMLAIALRFMVVSCAKQIDLKQGHFVPVEDEANLAERKLIATFQSPSELACSQKCLNHDKCKYKKFDLKTSTCDLLEEFAQEDVKPNVILTKKETLKKSTSGCQLMPADGCGEKCIKSNSNCDCRERGVYKSCSSALSANCFRKAIYRILPPGFSKLTAVECMLDNNNKSAVVIHHDNENTTLVHGYEDKGSYKREFVYKVDMETIIMIINSTNSCKQHTKADCLRSRHDGYDWLSGRGGKKLDYWGGGPSNGTGCACGIYGTCAKPHQKCNCDINSSRWYRDEGLVTKREDLPITAINVGDTGNPTERFKYTIGPLICVF